MSKAFVVEWDPVNYNVPIIGKIDYYGRYCYNDDPRSNGCYFAFNWFGVLHKCTYLVNSAYEAKVLARLLNRVSNFQIYCAVHDVLNKKNNDLGKDLYNFKERIESLGDEEGRSGWRYVYNSPKNQSIHQNVPFDIFEMDTKQPLKLGPCFFYEQYKMYDENGHPLYLAVAIERKNDGNENADLFNYKVKFIGSGQPLPKQWQPISLCDDVACYNQKSAEYKSKHAAEYENYANKIWAAITDPKYKRNFETYTYEKSCEWKKCYPVMGGFSCSNYYYMKYGYCYENHCPHWRGWTHNMAKHNGKAYYNRFQHVFGSELAQLAKNGACKDQHKTLMPDFSNPEFIDKFNNFQGGIRCLHYFDDEGYIQKRQRHLDSTLGHIKYWAQRPDFDVLRFVYCGNVQTISSLKPKTEQIEPECTEDSTTFPTDLKTRLLWHNMDRIESPVIYMKSPGCTKIIKSNVYSDYDYVNVEEDIYYDYTYSRIEYTKPKSKDNLKIAYKFPYPWRYLGYDLDYLMDDVHDIQTHDSNLKWGPSKLFSKDKERIEVMRANVDYNGIMVLNPKKMSPIKCDHYEILESQYDSGVDIQTKSQVYANNIFLFDKKGQISGIIHTWHVDKIIPHIIVTGQAKQK